MTCQHPGPEEAVPPRTPAPLHYSRASVATHPAGGVEHLEVQRVSGELALDLGQRVAGSHAGDKRRGRRPSLSDL